MNKIDGQTTNRIKDTDHMKTLKTYGDINSSTTNERTIYTNQAPVSNSLRHKLFKRK